MSPARGIVLCMILSGAGMTLADQALVPYREMRRDGSYVDWLDGYVGTTGSYVSSRDLSLSAVMEMANASAAENGRVGLLSLLKQLSIDSGRRLGDDPEIFEKVKKKVNETEAVTVDVSARSTVVAQIAVPLHGEGGILNLVLPPPAAKTLSASAETADTASNGRTGLVLDATGIRDAVPSLLPRIVDETGRAVYGIELVDDSAARAIGMAAFACRVEMKAPSTRLAPREGSNPLRVAAVGVRGTAKTDFIISSSDADLIQREAATSPFLTECRVVIVMPPVEPPARPQSSVPKRPPAPPKSIRDPQKRR